MVFALVDCNNFFVSCERVFNPKLRNKPVVVLSSNDGCVIARSQEAKAVGVPMGAPVFMHKDLIRAHNIITCSSNFALYSNMSSRVMATLQQFAADLEVYSVDEAFLLLDDEQAVDICQNIRRTVLQWTGIPVSIGLAPTKTLAKVAGALAKKYPRLNGIGILRSPAEWNPLLDTLPAEEIWGIGRRTAASLARFSIRTALQFAEADDAWIKKEFTVIGLRKAWELRGRPAIGLEEISADKKSIMNSRSFGKPVTTYEELAQAAATYIQRAAQKMRGQESVASSLEIFTIGDNGYKSAHVTFPQATDYSPTLISSAKQALRRIYQNGAVYKKVGILLNGLTPKAFFQPDLFTDRQVNVGKQQQVMEAVDSLNEKFGKGTIRFAAEGFKQEWQARHDKRSPRYSTSWDELLVVK